MITPILWLVLGLVLLIKGADWLVDGASALAKKYNVSDLAIGLTIVAFGTSAPELVVNVMGSIQGHHEIVFANVIGSNNFNLLVILGISGMITPLVVQSSTVWKEIPLSFFAALLLFIVANDFWTPDSFTLTRLDGALFLILFCGFLYYVYTQLSGDSVEISTPEKQYSQLKIWSFIVLGLVGLVFGGRLVVNNAIEIATQMGVSEKIIGLTIIAAGTSLPELATSIVAALRKNADIAVGNIIGSNIFNIFLILGISSVVSPIHFNPSFNNELFLLAAGTLLLFSGMFTGQKKKLDRWEAGVLLLIFVAYTWMLISSEL
ncbi:calcium/sodium antiporter [Gracilimonas mengyeensis]|uniref:Cation:H+ antiporter n=1 Tax=Gracilimonas mengyeensis TaxID=1302730 RepID=A0A521E5E7_9BACT|nr:calcium/sodium antiporter [Gracilimonas mengyeensis]SMO79163.1 cation:H+ antiporter [Gracilimonas mengyeensis]